MLPDEIVDLLVCPKSKRPLIYFPRGEDDRDEADAFLLCPASRLRYAVPGGVPALLIDEGIDVTPGALDALLARARALGLRVSPAGP